MAVNVLTNSPKIFHISQRLFQTWFSSQVSINIVKVLWFRFQQCFGQFLMLLVEGSSETWLFTQDPSTRTMVNGRKHCWKLNHSNFTIFIDNCKYSWGWKRFYKWYAKTYDCLLSHWLPMTSILFLTEAIYWNIFR